MPATSTTDTAGAGSKYCASSNTSYVGGRGLRATAAARSVHDDLMQRKSEHLDLALRREVEPDETDALFGCVRLVHRALPELRLSDVDLSAELCGARLRAPLMVTGMTGGTERAGQVNRD